MIVYILVKSYADGSAFEVCGATEDRAVAQAFHAGAKDADPHGSVYEVNTNDPVRGMSESYSVENFEDGPRTVTMVYQPETGLIPAPPASATSDDDDSIPF